MSDPGVSRKVALIVILGIASLTGCVVAYEQPVTSPPPVPAPAPPPPLPPPSPSIDIRFFWDALDPYGDWVWIDPYGWVWAPGRVDPFWRPYTVGGWVWTDWGWTWVSREPWGWAPYHYGRWVRAKRHGWVWIPGTVWGPAWVAWRHGGGAVGWAPLPPEARFRAGVGIDWGGVSIDVVVRNDAWCFVDDVRFVDADVTRWVHPVGRNATVIRATRDVPGVRVVDRRIVNEGVGRGEIERVAKRTIPVRRVVSKGKQDPKDVVVAGDEVRVFRPDVRETDPGAAPPRGRRPVEPPARAESAPPAGPEDAEAERQWDRRWNDDWRKLQKLQKQDETKAAPAPPAQPPEEVRVRHREENYEAAENAYREQEAAKERAKRRAERGAEKGKKGESAEGGEKAKEE
jgi:hypothetical protein